MRGLLLSGLMIMSFSTAFAFERYSNEQVTIQPGDGTYKTF